MSERTINLALKAKATQDNFNNIALLKQNILLREDIENAEFVEQVLDEANEDAANVVESSDTVHLTHAQENNDNKSNSFVDYFSNLFKTNIVSKDIVPLEEGTSESSFAGVSTEIADI